MHRGSTRIGRESTREVSPMPERAWDQTHVSLARYDELREALRGLLSCHPKGGVKCGYVVEAERLLAADSEGPK